MSKAVGGASAVGCGVFGLGGLLISVGLVVWLGSMALSGSTGGDDDGTTSAPTTATTVAALPADAALAVDPQEGLGDGGQMEASGTGFAPGRIVVTTCLTHQPGPLAERCDPAADVPLTTASDGGWSVSYPVRRMITVAGTDFDCAAAAGACSLVALLPDTDAGVGVPLSFVAGLDPIPATAPPAG